MSDSPGKRLASVRAETGLTQAQLAQSLGVSAATVAFVERDERPPSRTFLQKISERYRISADWLLNGAGQMHQPAIDRSILGVPMSEFIQVQAWPKGRHDALGEMGEFAFRSAWLRRYTTSPGECYLFRTSHNEMEPTIHAGAVVLIDQQRRDPRSGGVFALRIPDGGLSLRRLEMVENKIVVRADNPAYSLTIFPATDMHRVVGQVIWQSTVMVDPLEGQTSWN